MRERRQFLNCRCYVTILVFRAVPALCHAYSSSGAATGKKKPDIKNKGVFQHSLYS